MSNISIWDQKIKVDDRLRLRNGQMGYVIGIWLDKRSGREQILIELGTKAKRKIRVSRHEVLENLGRCDPDVYEDKCFDILGGIPQKLIDEYKARANSS